MAKPTNTMLAVAILIVASGVGGNGVTAGESAPLASVAQESEQPPPSLDQAADGVAQKAETAPEDTEGQSVTRAGEPEAFWRGVKTLISRLLGSRRRLVAFLNYARVQIAMFDATLQAFQLDIGDYPSTAQGLEALRTPPADLPNPDKWAGPYLAKPVPLDPWDNPYQYQYPGKHDPKKPDIWSFGPDGVDGTEDDVVSWVALEKFAPGGRRARKPIEFALVSGTVTLDGQPLADATLEFQPTRVSLLRRNGHQRPLRADVHL